MPTEDVTLGELRRTMIDLRKSVDVLNENVKRLSVLEWRVQEAEKDLKELGNQQVRQEERRATDRRLVFTALIAPVLLLVFQVYATARGVS